VPVGVDVVGGNIAETLVIAPVNCDFSVSLRKLRKVRNAHVANPGYLNLSKSRETKTAVVVLSEMRIIIFVTKSANIGKNRPAIR